MTLHQLGSLNEDELAMALYIVNCLEPKILTYELGRRLLCSIKHHKLCERVVKSEPFINELGMPILVSLKSKLGISIDGGTSGVAGSNSTSGTSGVDGTSGTSGTSGINGTSGTSGSGGV